MKYTACELIRQHKSAVAAADDDDDADDNKPMDAAVKRRGPATWPGNNQLIYANYITQCSSLIF